VRSGSTRRSGRRLIDGARHLALLLPGAPIYGDAIVALASPTASVIIFALIAGFYVLESSSATG
jgi:hypothetical protein